MGMGGDKPEEMKMETSSGMEIEGKKRKKNQKKKGEDKKDGISHESNKGPSKQKVEEINGNHSKKSDEVSVKMETPILVEVQGKKKKQKQTGADEKDGISHESNKGPGKQKVEDIKGNQSKKTDGVSAKKETPTSMEVDGKKKKQKQKGPDAKKRISHESSKGPSKHNVEGVNANQYKKSDEVSGNMEIPSAMEVNGKKKKPKGADAKDEVSHKSTKVPSKPKAEDVNGNQSKISHEVNVKMEMNSVMGVNGKKKKQKPKKGEPKLKAENGNDELSKKCDHYLSELLSEGERKKKEQKPEGVNDPISLQSKQGTKEQNLEKVDGEGSVKSKKVKEERNVPSVLSLVLSFVSRQGPDPALNEFVNGWIVEENDVTLEEIFKCYVSSKCEQAK